MLTALFSIRLQWKWKDCWRNLYSSFPEIESLLSGMDVTDICHQAWKVCCQEARQSLERLKNEHLATLVPGKQVNMMMAVVMMMVVMVIVINQANLSSTGATEQQWTGNIQIKSWELFISNTTLGAIFYTRKHLQHLSWWVGRLVRPSVCHTFRFPLCLCLWTVTQSVRRPHLLKATALRLWFTKCIFLKCTLLMHLLIISFY